MQTLLGIQVKFELRASVVKTSSENKLQTANIYVLIINSEWFSSWNEQLLRRFHNNKFTSYAGVDYDFIPKTPFQKPKQQAKILFINLLLLFNYNSILNLMIPR